MLWISKFLSVCVHKSQLNKRCVEVEGRTWIGFDPSLIRENPIGKCKINRAPARSNAKLAAEMSCLLQPQSTVLPFVSNLPRNPQEPSRRSLQGCINGKQISTLRLCFRLRLSLRFTLRLTLRLRCCKCCVSILMHPCKDRFVLNKMLSVYQPAINYLQGVQQLTTTSSTDCSKQMGSNINFINVTNFG